MAQNLQVTLDDKDQDKLAELASGAGDSMEETASRLLKEKVREAAFPRLEFRESGTGREIYIKGTRLKVWQVVMNAQDSGMNAAEVARHLWQRPEDIEAALAYAAAYPDEIQAMLDFVESFTFEDLKKILPDARESIV